MGIFIPNHFQAFELVDAETYKRFGPTALRYFRPEILKALDWVHENYPIAKKSENRTITVNDWYWKGRFEWRGLRLPRSPDYKEWSAHNGAAIDFSANGCEDEKMRDWIIEEHLLAEEHEDHDYPVMGIRRMERGTKGWVHIDCLEHSAAGIWMVNP